MVTSVALLAYADVAVADCLAAVQKEPFLESQRHGKRVVDIDPVTPPDNQPDAVIANEHFGSGLVSFVRVVNESVVADDERGPLATRSGSSGFAMVPVRGRAGGQVPL